MALELALLAAAATLTGAERTRLDTPVHFAVTHTLPLETSLPPDVFPATLWPEPTGRIQVSSDPRHALVQNAASVVAAIARALPVSVEDERIVREHMAKVIGEREARPLRRRLGE